MSVGIHRRDIMKRADEPSSQLTYYLYKNSKKNNTPAILKRSWVRRIESMNRYDIAKYKNHGIGLIDTIRICHAKDTLIDELMRTGTVSASVRLGMVDFMVQTTVWQSVNYP